MDIKQKAMEYLQANHTLRLATVTSDGQPMAHTVEYVTDGQFLYFSTSIKSRKAMNIASNSKTGGAIDEFMEDWNQIKGLQLEFKTSQVTDQIEIEKVMGLFIAKFPQMKDMPPSPDMGVYKLEITHGHMLDYTLGFGHWDEISL